MDRTHLRNGSDEALRKLSQEAVKKKDEWNNQRMVLEAEQSMWQFRAEQLAKRVREDGYTVTWSGSWKNHSSEIQPPMPIQDLQVPTVELPSKP
jgi:hypothetical protein